jgi:hypothetical protein
MLKAPLMANWILNCRHCGQSFSVFQIGDSLSDYFFPVKPKFPPEGMLCECPDCKIVSIYRESELRYEAVHAATAK